MQTTVTIEAVMEAGIYNIVPCLFDANLEGSFSLIVYASADFELVLQAYPTPALGIETTHLTSEISGSHPSIPIAPSRLQYPQ